MAIDALGRGIHVNDRLAVVTRHGSTVTIMTGTVGGVVDGRVFYMPDEKDAKEKRWNKKTERFDIEPNMPSRYCDKPNNRIIIR